MAKSADAFRTISEVAEWLDTPAHVLRFWESKFSQVKPVKRAGGRRYYRPADMKLLGGIKQLLHEDGLTIKGVQKILREQGIKHVAGLSQPLDEVTEAEATEAADVTIEVAIEDTAPSSADVVNLRPEPDSSASKAPSATAKAKAASAAKADEQAAAEAAKKETESQASEGQATEAPETVSGAPSEAEGTPAKDAAPTMPSFLHRAAPEETPTTDNMPADSAESSVDVVEDAAPAPTKRPDTPSVPEDPTDDIAAEPGTLSALAKLSKPVSSDALSHFKALADQLGSGSSSSHS